jgi:hypothetical protein
MMTEKNASAPVRGDCLNCYFWAAPKTMPEEREAIARAHGVKRTGFCHRFPRTEDTGPASWCGEFRRMNTHAIAEEPAGAI